MPPPTNDPPPLDPNEMAPGVYAYAPLPVAQWFAFAAASEEVRVLMQRLQNLQEAREGGPAAD